MRCRAPPHAGKANKWPKLLGVLGSMEAAGVGRDAFTYTALLSACQAGGRWQQALEWFAELEAGAKAARSAAVASAAAVPAKAAAGLGEKGGVAQRRPPRGSPPRPNVVHYTTLMTVLQRAGQWEQVREGRACWKQEGRALMGFCCCCARTPAQVDIFWLVA